jgi:hypothetical protein
MEALHHHIEPCIFGELPNIQFFCDGPIKLPHYKKRRKKDKGLDRHPSN